MTRTNWKKALYYAAEQAYQSEVIDTGMQDLIIGKGQDYADKQDWIDQKIQEWLTESEAQAEREPGVRYEKG